MTLEAIRRADEAIGGFSADSAVVTVGQIHVVDACLANQLKLPPPGRELFHQRETSNPNWLLGLLMAGPVCRAKKTPNSQASTKVHCLHLQVV